VRTRKLTLEKEVPRSISASSRRPILKSPLEEKKTINKIPSSVLLMKKQQAQSSNIFSMIENGKLILEFVDSIRLG
jgi:hypothetical protein